MSRPPAAPADVTTACPCCGSALSPPFYQSGPVPVHSCLMLDTAADALSFPTGHLSLAACPSCGFVTNTLFDAKWSAYAPEYEDQQSYSPTFNAFAAQLARDLIDRHNLHHKSALEVGCSKGDFLSLLCEHGAMRTIGIDPSAVAGRLSPPQSGSIRLINAYYGAQHLKLPADLLCCRHTLEHIRPVHETLALMHRHMRQNPGAVLLIEVPDATRIWQQLAFEDIYYEHCSYFTAASLASAVRAAGFAVTDLRREYDDQYLVLEATLNASDDRSFAIEDSVPDQIAAITNFAGNVEALKSRWLSRVNRAKSAGEKVAVWGSGSKSLAFILGLDLTAQIDAIVDINPNRAGKFAPAMPVAIQSPDALRQLAPDTIIMMNRIYRDEISTHCARLGLNASLIALGEL